MVEIKKKSIEGIEVTEDPKHREKVAEFSSERISPVEQDPAQVADSLAEQMDSDTLKVPPVGEYVDQEEPVNYGEGVETLDKIAKAPPVEIPKGRPVDDLLKAMQSDMTTYKRAEDAGERNTRKAA